MIIISLTISVIAVLLSLWIGRRSPVRSVGLTSGMLVLLVLTPVLFLFPKIEVHWLNTASLESAALVSQTELIELAQSSSGWLWSVSGIWILGSAIFLLRIALECRTVMMWRQQATPARSEQDQRLLRECAAQLGLSSIPDIRYTSQLSSPVITGLLKPILLLPYHSQKWSLDTLRMVILHELGHLQRKDLWSNMVAHLACAFHWFNPLVWILRKQLRSECEYACDAHVIAHGTNMQTYITALCDVAEDCRQRINDKSLTATSAPATVLAMANPASLKKRVAKVLDGQSTSCRWLVIGVLTLSGSATLGFSLLRPQSAHSAELMGLNETTESPAVEGALEYSFKEIDERLSANPFPAE